MNLEDALQEWLEDAREYLELERLAGVEALPLVGGSRPASLPPALQSRAPAVEPAPLPVRPSSPPPQPRTAAPAAPPVSVRTADRVADTSSASLLGTVASLRAAMLSQQAESMAETVPPKAVPGPGVDAGRGMGSPVPAGPPPSASIAESVRISRGGSPSAPQGPGPRVSPQPPSPTAAPGPARATRQEPPPARPAPPPRPAPVLDVPPEEIDPNQASLFGGEYRKRPQLEMPSLPPFSALPPQNPAQALAALREEVGACTRCPRMAGRTHLIFGEGNVSASLLLLCDTPGSEDDRVGRAFQGEAGGLLARILETMLQLKPEDVFLTHLVMCHAPGGREASPEEISTCWTLLEKQVAVVRPQLIVTLGPQSARALLRTGQPLHRLRGHWFEQWGIPVLPTFAPQLLLQAPEHKRSVRDDMRQVAARLESLRSGHRG